MKKPNITATVETPSTPNTPNNYIAQQVAGCRSVEECDALLAHAKQHGYNENGQTVQLIRARRSEFREGKRRGPAVDEGQRRGRAKKRGAR